MSTYARRDVAWLTGLLLLAACPSDDDQWRTAPDDTAATGETGETAETGGTPYDTQDTGEEDTETGFDEPGDVVELDPESGDSDGTMEIDLTDESGDSNTDQEFYLLLVNTSEEEATYGLKYVQNDEGSTEDTGSSKSDASRPWGLAGLAGHLVGLEIFDEEEGPSGRGEPSPFRRRLRDYIREKGGPGLQHPARPLPPPFDTTDIGTAVDQFHVRDDLSDDSSYSTVTATLWALGDSVAIWVDNDVAIDWYYDCDDTSGDPDEEDPGSSYGFDNCDLQDIADIVDTNIMVNLQSLFGDWSDENGDGQVTVLITPVLNTMPTREEDEEEWAAVVESYADPEVDLNDYERDENPGSDEQEIIYVFAPDPYGYYNPFFTTTVDSYTSVTLAGEIAQVMEELISYNLHVLVNEGDAEESWLDQALGSVAADLTGFGANFYADAWDYLDLSHLESLISEAEESTLSSETHGAQYLFARWLVDTYGTSILADLVNTSNVGVDNVEAATGEEMEDLLVSWQMALLTTGITDEEGEPLVDADTWSPYADAEFVEAPTEAPDDGEAGTYYGANGYQMGININGTNYYYENGTTDDPVENTAERVTCGNTDFFTYNPEFDFNGYLEGDYTAQVVRLTGITYDEASLRIDSSSDGLVGAVVRWKDPESADLEVENSASVTQTAAFELPALPSDGTPVYGLGRISASGRINVVSEGSDTVTADVYDTDRWRLDLTGRTMGEPVEVAIWLDRQYGDSAGDAAPHDPWLAVVEEDLVPAPDEETVTRDACDADDAVDFEYPQSVLEYLYYQQVLVDTPYSDDEVSSEGDDTADTGGSSGSGGFDPCGDVAEGDTGGAMVTTCAEDWDLDGVLDEDEPQPTDFLNQVRVEQCSQADEDPYVDTDIIDWDSLDENDDAYFHRSNNTGGNSDDSGEGAYIEIMLKGGYSYLVVVGGSNDTGVYEINAKQVNVDD